MQKILLQYLVLFKNCINLNANIFLTEQVIKLGFWCKHNGINEIDMPLDYHVWDAMLERYDRIHTWAD